MYIAETISGAPYEMGHQYGAAFRHMVQQIVARYTAQHSHLIAKNRMTGFVRHKLEQTREQCSGLLDEMNGIADGAGVSREEIILLNARVEFDPEQSVIHSCSCVAFRADDGVFAGGTQDAPRENYVLVRRVPAQGYAHVCTHIVGTVGAMEGMNTKGLTVSSASLPLKLEGPPPRKREILGGEMWGVSGRYILEKCATVAQVRELAERFSIPKNSVYADASGDMLGIQGVLWDNYLVEPEAEAVVLTNHVVHPELARIVKERGDDTTLGNANSVDRYQITRRILGPGASRSRGWELLNKIMLGHEGYPHSICKDNTALMFLARPDQAPGRIWIGDRFACSRGLRQYPIAPENE